MHLLIVLSKRKWLCVSEPSPFRSGLLLTRWDTSGNFCSFIKLLWFLSRTMNSACRIKNKLTGKTNSVNTYGKSLKECVWVCFQRRKRPYNLNKSLSWITSQLLSVCFFPVTTDQQLRHSQLHQSAATASESISDSAATLRSVPESHQSAALSLMCLKRFQYLKHIMNNSVRCLFLCVSNF